MDVSVIVATRNSALFLAEALQSVRAQSGVKADLIVVDASSTDQTATIARAFGARIVAQDGLGLAAAWNIGVTEAAAPFIAFLDSDDQWIENTLAARLQTARSLPGSGMSVGRTRYVLHQGFPRPPGLAPELFTTERLAPIPGALVIARQLFEIVGRFDPSFEIAADVDWVGRASGMGYTPVAVDRLVLCKRIHGENLSLRVEQNTRELMRALRGKISSARINRGRGGDE
jgi:glycosyltransferase involved in cell wall biosynthesis